MNKRGIILTPADFDGVDYLKLMHETGLNTLGIHSGNGANHDLFARLGRFATPEFRAEVAAAGLACEYETHAASSLMDPSLFPAHPEYFAVDAKTGERTCKRNWCITHPDVPAMVADNAEKLARRLPSSTHRYYFWCADFRGANCRCPECSKYSVADLQLRSVNAIAAGLRRVDPRAEISYLAYLDLDQPPVCTEPADGVFLEYAPFHRSYTESIADPCNEKFRRSFEALTGFFGSRNCCILEYWLDSSYFSRYKKPAVRPTFSDAVLRRDLDYYLGTGAHAVTTFAVYMDGEYFETYGDDDLRRYAATLKEYLP